MKGKHLYKHLLSAAYVAAIVTTSFGIDVATNEAQALYCPPGFESLPGCSGSGGGDTGGDTGPVGGGTGSWTRETIGGMSVNIYKPSVTGNRLNDQRALMINLHGCAQTSSDLKNGGNWEATADQYGMVVAIPDAPNGGVIAGCWDYYDSQSRSGKHVDNLITLAQTLRDRSSLDIDADQIYISGLSSGGGQTMVMGCIAPELFAGMGINAGPTIGTSSSQIGNVATSQSSAKSLCNSFAGSNKAHLQTQITSVIDGTMDFTVAQGYGDLNAAVMASIYGASKNSGTTSVAGGGTETSWNIGSTKAVQRISVSGMGHAWPAGGGSGGSYIDTSHVNYPYVLTKFLFENNRRADASNDPQDPQDPQDPEDPPVTQCEQETTYNYYHKSAGRATSSGSYWSPTYKAVGSGETMSGSTWGNSTLYSTDGGSVWHVGSCP